MQTLKGKVIKKKVAPGSKSERDAFLLTTGSGQELILRQSGGNPFDNHLFSRFLGKTIKVSGHLHGQYFLAEDCEEY